MSPERVSSAELVRRLDRLHRGRHPAVLAFDGDGTLWQGDVAEDVFHRATQQGLLVDAPVAHLREVARAHGLGPSGDSNRIAASLFEAYLAGRFPERTLYEIMAWCFAGLSVDELAASTRQALDDARLDERLNKSLEPVMDWANAQKVRVVIISASPRFIVEEAARRWNIPPRDIAAATPALDSGRVLPRLSSPVPYGPAKVQFGRQLFADAVWLASFGDSPFDLDMLGAAELGVAVRAKPGLLAALAALPRAVSLEE